MKSFFGSYLGHMAGSIVSLAGVVSAIDPRLIPQPWGFVTAIAGLVVTIGHGAYQHGGASAALAAAATAATNALKSTAPLLLALLCFVGMASGLTACSTVESFVSKPSSAPYIQAAVDVAVATAESKGISAAQINTIAHRALLADQGAGATLAAVSEVVNGQIAQLRLSAPDQAAADIVLAALSASIQTQLQSNPSVAQAQAAAAVVINDVIAATGG